MRKIVKAFEVGREEGRAAADTIRQSLVRDFIDEREFDYGAVTTRKAISHFTRFIAQIWQVHPFGEGNTRTTAVFAIKYLNSLGFKAANNMFRDNSRFFRNALVRANFADYARGVKRDWSYLEMFFRNLLLEFLRDHPRSTQKDMVAFTGINRSAVQRHLKNLMTAGRLRRIGPDKGGHWEVSE